MKLKHPNREDLFDKYEKNITYVKIKNIDKFYILKERRKFSEN